MKSRVKVLYVRVRNLYEYEYNSQYMVHGAWRRSRLGTNGTFRVVLMHLAILEKKAWYNSSISYDRYLKVML